MRNAIVLIADIVNSRIIENRHVFQRDLKAIINTVNERSRTSHLSPITLTLGDEFQAVYGGFRTLFPDMIDIMTSIHPYQLRIAIAHGQLSTDINPNAALEMDGSAFIKARELMESLKKARHTMMQIATTEAFNPDLTNLCLRLVSKEIARWKSNTLKIFDDLLNHARKEQIAGALQITKRAVDQQIATHHLEEYTEMLDLVANELAMGLETEVGS